MNGPLGYRVVRALARALLRIFYRRVDVAGLERVPARGGLVVVANHQNALVDPMLLLATLPRRIVPIAKAPLFRMPLIGWLLRLAGAIPVHRRQDEDAAGADSRRNTDMFRDAATALREDRAVLIFPEGVSQPEPLLMPLRTGAARMALGAGAAPVTILPVGLVYDEPGTFRRGRAVILIGPPLVIDPSGGAPSQDVVRRLTADIESAIRRQIVEARDRETFRLARLADAIWSAEVGEERRDAAGRVAALQQIMRAHDVLARLASGRLDTLRRDLEDYAADLDAAGLPGVRVPGSYPARTVLRYVWREGLSLALAFPLAVWGMAVHALPYGLTALAARVARPSADVEATFKMVAGVVLYPLCWGAESWLAWSMLGRRGVAVFAVLLLPAGLLALTWRERWERVRRDVRGFVHFVLHRDIHRRLLARRRALAEEMQDLAGLVPAAAPESGARP